MADKYNQHEWSFLGPEVTPRTADENALLKVIGSDADVLIETFTSGATATVNAMAKWYKNLSTTATNQVFAGIVEEVTLAGSEIPANVTQATFLPNASSQTGVTGTYANLLPGGGSVSNTPANTSGHIHCDFATAGALAGKRILRVRFYVTCLAFAFEGPATIKFDLNSAGISTTPIVLASSAGNPDIGISNNVVVVLDTGEWEPSSGDFWTVARLQQMDAGTFRLDINLCDEADVDALAQVFISNLSMVVDYCDENRLSRDLVQIDSTTALQRAYWTPHTPAAVANLAKTNALSYSLISRTLRTGDLPAPFQYASQVGILTTPTFTAVPTTFPSIRTAGTIDATGRVTALGPPNPNLMSDLEVMVASVVVADSQVYYDAYDNAGAAWTSLQQEFTQSSGGAVTYAGALLVGRYNPDANGAVSNLTVALKKRSDNSVVATATVTKADVDAAIQTDTGNGLFSLIQATFAAAFATVSGTQYYLDLSAAHPADWTFPMLRASNASSSGAQGWHGATDRGTFNGTETTEYDFPWLLFSSIAAPAGLASTPSTDAVQVADALCAGAPDGCLIDGIGVNALAWTATTLGAVFSHYEVQRQDAYSDWETIALISLEGVHAFRDYEARLGLVSSYRIRVVTTLGVVSPWSGTVTGTAPSAGVGYTFTSNANPAGNCAYSDTYEGQTASERAFASPEATELTTQRLSGRDYVVAFQPCERRGVTFQRPLLVNAMGTPTTVGVHAFDALRDLAKVGVPYVCVRDEEGDRWFMALTVPDFRIRNPKQFYLVTVTGVEVQGVASAALLP